MDSRAVLDFLLLAGLLKTNKRTGWLLRGVTNPESIADHQYRMALAASVAWVRPSTSAAASPVLVALVHDIAEALVGDFAPHDNISKRDKRVLEAAAIRTLRACLGWSSPPAIALQAAWEAYEHQTSAAGRFVKQLDKLEMCVQALEYEATWGAQQGGAAQPSPPGQLSSGSNSSAAGTGPLEEFYSGVAEKLTSPLLQGCFINLQERRDEVLGGGAVDPPCAREAPPPFKPPKKGRARSTSRRAASSLSVAESTGGGGGASLPTGATDTRQAFLPLDPTLLAELRGGALLQPDIVLGFGGQWPPAYRELIQGALRRAEERKKAAEGGQQKEQGVSAVPAEEQQGSHKAAGELVDWGARKAGSGIDEALLLACGVLVCFALLQLMLD